jgi:hypothetical protein
MPMLGDENRPMANARGSPGGPNRPCGCRTPHAANLYSWTRPPSVSEQSEDSDEGEIEKEQRHGPVSSLGSCPRKD